MLRVPQVAQVERYVQWQWFAAGGRMVGRGDMSLSGCQFGDWMSLRPDYPTHLSVVLVISQSTVWPVPAWPSDYLVK